MIGKYEISFCNSLGLPKNSDLVAHPLDRKQPLEEVYEF
jgi:hypothetical protein